MLKGRYCLKSSTVVPQSGKGAGSPVVTFTTSAGGPNGPLFALDFAVLEDVTPYVFNTDNWETNLNSGGDANIQSGEYLLLQAAAYQTRTVKAAALDLTGQAQVFVEAKMDAGSDGGTSEHVLGLAADDAPGEWYGNFANGGMENGYRYKIVGANLYVLRDVSGSYTLADTMVIDALAANSPSLVRIVVTVGGSDVTHQVYQDGVLKDTFVESHASRHTNFRRAGFSMTSFGTTSSLINFRSGSGSGA